MGSRTGFGWSTTGWSRRTVRGFRPAHLHSGWASPLRDGAAFPQLAPRTGGCPAGIHPDRPGGPPHSAGWPCCRIHRLVHGLNTSTKRPCSSSARPIFQVYEMGTPPEYIETNMDALHRQAKKAFAYYSGGKTWHLLLLKRRNADGPALPGAKPGHAEPERLLCTRSSWGMLGIGAESLAKQENLTYTRHFSEALASARSGKANAFLSTRPASKRVREVADAGGDHAAEVHLVLSRCSPAWRSTRWTNNPAVLCAQFITFS